MSQLAHYPLLVAPAHFPIQFGVKSLLWLVLAMGAFLVQLKAALAARENLPVIDIVVP